MSKVQIPPRLYRKLRARAKREKKTIEQVLDDAIVAALNDEERWS